MDIDEVGVTTALLLLERTKAGAFGKLGLVRSVCGQCKSCRAFAMRLEAAGFLAL